MRLLAAGFVFLALASAEAASLKDGLIAHWPMNGVDGDVITDVSGNGRNAFAEWVEAREGRGQQVVFFDGKRSKILLPEDPAFEFPGGFGISFWVRLEKGGTHPGPIFARESLAVVASPSGIRFNLLCGGGEKPAAFSMIAEKVMNDGEWHHVVVTYNQDARDATIYVDGQDVIYRKVDAPPIPSRPTILGARKSQRFLGELSDMRVYARALTAEDVEALRTAKASE